MKAKTMPSLRGRERYIAFSIHSDGRLGYYNVNDSIMNSLLRWIGEYSMAKAETRLIRNLWNEKEQTGVLQCSHKFVDLVKTGLALIHQIGDEKVVFQTLRVSGTIKGVKKNKQV